VTEKASDV